MLSLQGFAGCDPGWMKKYGKVYGSYFFTQPEIVISDEELLKKVLVKDFHNFTNRRVSHVFDTKFGYVLILYIFADFRNVEKILVQPDGEREEG